MNTKEAWLKMISTPGVEEHLGITTRSRDWFRSQARNQNKYPTINKMEEQLTKAGFKVVQEKIWEEKIPQDGIAGLRKET